MNKEEKDKNKEERLKKEISRLKCILNKLDKKRKKIAEPLIYRASFKRIELEDMEKDLNENGWVEMFSQSEKQDPYERQRPLAQAYVSLCTSYQKDIKQLMDLIPKEEKKTDSELDGINDFINGYK